MSGVAGIGEILVKARREQGLSQRALGLAVGVKQQQVARWEATRYRTATLRSIEAVANALGLIIGTPDHETSGLSAAEATATYGARAPAEDSAARITEAPVRDLVEVIERIRAHADELRRCFSVRRVGVYGSLVRGEQDASSDIDLLVELDSVTFDTEFGVAARLQGLLGRRVDLALPTELDPRIRDRILAEVVYVWEA